MVTMNIAHIYFAGKKYTYEFKTPSANTDSAIAMSISQSMWEKEHKQKLTKFSGAPQHYNLLMELLRRKRNVYTSNTGKIDYFAEASQRTNEEVHTFDEGTNAWKVLVWRVGKTFSNRLVIDMDSHDRLNLVRVVNAYEGILGVQFRIIKTHAGYWLISKQECANKQEFVFQNCKVLCPEITPERVDGFLNLLFAIDYDSIGNFVKASEGMIRDVPGVKPIGVFDIRFNFLSIKREQSTLRISKKRPDEKIEEVIL